MCISIAVHCRIKKLLWNLYGGYARLATKISYEFRFELPRRQSQRCRRASDPVLPQGKHHDAPQSFAYTLPRCAQDFEEFMHTRVTAKPAHPASPKTRFSGTISRNQPSS